MKITLSKSISFPTDKSPPLLPGSVGLSSSSLLSDPLTGKPNTLLLEAERGKPVERESPGSPSDMPPAGGPVYKTRRSKSKQPASLTGPDTKVMVVWLESFEDHHNFPIGGSLSDPAENCHLNVKKLPKT